MSHQVKIRQHAFARVILGIVLIIAAGCAGTAAAQSSVIRVGIQHVPPDDVYLAKNWAEPYGFTAKITQFPSGGEMLKAFIAGRVDTANGGSARLVTLAAELPDIFYIIAVEQYGGDRYGLMVKKDSPIANINQLKGKKIAAVTGSGAFNSFRLYLEQHKLSVGDFKIVNMKVTDMGAAVQSGVVDAALAWEPNVAIAESKGMVKRIDSMKGVTKSPNFVLVRRKFADEHPQLVVKFIASLLDADHLIQTDPGAAGKLAAKVASQRGAQVSPDALALAFKRIHVDGPITDDLLEELTPIAKGMLDAHKIDHIPDVKKQVNRSFYDKVAKLARSGSSGT